MRGIITSNASLFLQLIEMAKEKGCCGEIGWKDGGRDSRHRARVPRLKIDQAPGAVGSFFRGSSFAVAGHPGVRG